MLGKGIGNERLHEDKKDQQGETGFKGTGKWEMGKIRKDSRNGIEGEIRER